MVNIASDIIGDETNLPGQEAEGEAIELQDLGQELSDDGCLRDNTQLINC